MKKRILGYYILVFLSFSCQKVESFKVDFVNDVDQLVFQSFEFELHANVEIDAIVLQSPLRSFSLPFIALGNDNYQVVHSSDQLVVEGPSHIFVSSGGEVINREVNLVNINDKPHLNQDFRTPKTLNPDSSLVQQQITFSFDQGRNLIAKGNQLFNENFFELNPQTKVYRAIESSPVTSFYVEPGTGASLPLRMKSKTLSKEVVVGPVLDIHGNRVADGTLVSIFFKTTDRTYKREVLLKNGAATVPIPSNYNAHSVYAEMLGVKSNSVLL